jgi:D-glycero-D-manno-heptose 1,7-bisphosphate phosphatase
VAVDGSRAAVFLDKDGTVVDDVPYNVDPSRIALAEGVGEALGALARAGYAIVLVSNQSGVARGLFPESALAGVARHLEAELGALGVRLDGFYFCPHHPDGRVREYAVACCCRKPMPGMLERAAADHGLQLARSWMVGDILDDVEAGRRAGCRTVLVDIGHETEWDVGPLRRPDLVVPNLPAAAEAIVAASDPAVSGGPS